MKIKELADVIKDSVKGNQIGLSAIARLNSGIFLILENTPFPQAYDLTLNQVTVDYDAEKDAFTIKGISPWETGLQLNFTFKFTKKENHIVVFVTVELPGDHVLGIPGLKWFRLEEASLTFESIPGTSPAASLTRGYKGSLNCKLKIDDVTIPIGAAYPSTDGIELEAGLEDIEFPGLADLAKIAGGKDAFDLPEQIDRLGKIKLYHIGLSIQPSSKGVNKLSRINFEFGTAGKWELIPDIFTIEGIRITTNIFQPLDSANRRFGGGITGELSIGGVPLVLSAEKYFPGDPWSFTALIPSIDLSDLAEKALKQFSLPVDLPAIRFKDTRLEVTPGTGDFSFQTQSASDTQWKIPLGDKELVIKELGLEASKTGGSLQGKIKGAAELFDSFMTVEANLKEQLSISGTISAVNFSTLIEELLKGLSIPVDLPDFAFKDIAFSLTPASGEFTLQAASANEWQIPLGFTGVDIDNVAFSIQRQKGNDNKYKTSGFIGGKAKIGGVSFDLLYNFPGDFVLKANIPSINLSPILQDLCDAAELMGFPAPGSVMNVTLSDIAILAAPQAKTFSISGSSPFGKTGIIVKKTGQGKWGFTVGFAPPANWKFSAIDNSLKVLDDLKFSNTALIITSAEDESLPLTIIEAPSGISVIRGVNLFASLDLTGLGIDDLMNLKALTVSAAVGPNPASIRLEAGIGGSFKITDNIALGDMKFRLTPAPTNFSLGVSGAVLATLDKSPLKFVGVMEIRPIERSAAFSATMPGTWNEPFGIKGLAVGDVAIEVGIGIVPPPAVVAPIVGLAGTITIGSFTGSAAVKFDTANPGKSMIAASFNRLYLKEVMQSFCDPRVYSRIPKEIKNTVLAVGFEDAAVYVVPQPTRIGELHYEAGFRFQGKMAIAGFDAEAFFLLDYSKGIAIKGTMDEINIENIFILSGSGDQPKPLIDIDLRLGGNPGIEIAGSLQLLGLKSEARVSISDKGFYFLIHGKIFNLFDASLEVQGGNLKEGGDFLIAARMKNDLFAYLREKAAAAIQSAADSASRELSRAQGDLTNAQNKVNSLQRDIDNMRDTIKKERARDARRVKDAENAVKSAQDKVNSLQRQIDNMRKTIQGERDRDTRRLRSAQNEVANAQKKVNGIQGEINSTNRRIDQLKQDIKNKKRWYDKSKWYQKSYRWAEYSAYATAKGAEITGLYTKIGGLETAKATAVGVLEAAKQVVKGIEKAAETFPIDADPRIAGLFTARESANGVLEAAKQTLKGLQATIKTFPIDADPRIAGLFTAKETANASLEAAKKSLQGVKAAVGGIATVGKFIAEKGLGGLLDVREARFQGQLNLVKGGSVNLYVKVVFMEKESSLSFGFNFNDPLSGAGALADKLIAMVK